MKIFCMPSCEGSMDNKLYYGYCTEINFGGVKHW